jgi:hypothetical protein
LLLAVAMAVAACTGAEPRPGRGTGGNGDTGGTAATGGTVGQGGGGATGGSGSGTGGAAGIATGGTVAADAAAIDAPSDAASGTTADSGSTWSGDGGTAPRPDAMGQACKSAQNEAFTVTAFEPQTGVFTAWFTATPSIAPSNSVVGLSDGDVGPGSGDTPLHNLHQILLRFGASGALDARNGATYSADSVIKYQAIPYDFRLVVDLPGKKYSAYVSWNGQPEVTIGTNLAYRDSARIPTKFDHWAVQAVSAKTTVCGFLVRAN